MAEVPWFTEPPPARLLWPDGDEAMGFLHFVDPKGQRQVIWVTKGPGRDTKTGFGNIWHIEIEDDQATVSPSVWFKGDWHTPNPAIFVLVDELPEPV